MKFRTNISVLDQYSSSNISKIALSLLGIILLSVSSKVQIPFYPVPMTLQTFVVYFIAATMGMVGFYSTLSYFTLGLVGLPLFAKGGGFWYVMDPAFGYLVGMVFASFVIALLSKNLFEKKILKISMAVLIGTFITFAFGIVHLSMLFDFKIAIANGLVPFVYSEILKIALSIFLVYVLIKKN